MYRPQKSPKVPLAAAELPPSYDSLFTEENPPNYSRVANTVNLPTLEERNQTENDNVANDNATASDILDPDAIISGARSVENRGNTSSDGNSTNNLILPDQASAVNILPPLAEGSSRIMENSLPINIESNAMANLPNESVNTILQRIGENIDDNSDSINQPLASASEQVNNSEETIEDHCQCDCDHTDCNGASN